MSGKMNWDRVRKENQIFHHGSAWVEITDPPLRSKGQSKATRPIAIGRKMPGCTCGKTVGFVGLHKKKCPLAGGLGAKKQYPSLAAAKNPRTSSMGQPFEGQTLTLAILSAALNEAGITQLWKDFVQAQIRHVNHASMLDQINRARISKVLEMFSSGL